MGLPSEMRDIWIQKRKSFIIIASPSEDHPLTNSQKCSQEAAVEGAKSAAIAAVVATVPTLAAVRYLPWAKANLNYVAQSLIISAASIAAYFITADKTILECARKKAQFDRTVLKNDT